MLSIAEAEIELAVFKLVGYSIDRDTDNLVFTTRTTNGFESTTVVASNNPDYRQIVALIARKSYDTVSNCIPAYSTGEATTNKGGKDTDSVLENDVVIVYDRVFNDYTHNGYVIGNLELFIAKCLELKMNLIIKELSWYIFQSSKPL